MKKRAIEEEEPWYVYGDGHENQHVGANVQAHTGCARRCGSYLIISHVCTCSPICQDSMSASDALAWCQFGCGRSVHTKCMRIWGQHQASTQKPITCPLCREEWGSATLEALYQQVRRQHMHGCVRRHHEHDVMHVHHMMASHVHHNMLCHIITCTCPAPKTLSSHPIGTHHHLPTTHTRVVYTV